MEDLKHYPHGKFLSCKLYPEHRHTEEIVKCIKLTVFHKLFHKTDDSK